MAARQRSIRTRLLLIVLAPPVLLLPLVVTLLWHWGDRYYDAVLRYKVSSDLGLAHAYFDRVVNDVAESVRSLAGSAPMARSAGNAESIANLLRTARDERRLDFLMLLDNNGRITVSANQSATVASANAGPTALLRTQAVIGNATQGLRGTGIDRLPEELLTALDPAIARRARVQLVDTPQARPTDRTVETRGLVAHAAAPVVDASGKQTGVLYGGLLLNQNLDFVDRINDIVYRPGALPLASRGTATLFLDDVRVATNVRLFAGERAIGTRVSGVVRRHVLDEGNTWLDSAFVVNDSYVSGYEPILDSLGQRVGMLYVGFLEEPFRRAKHAALALIIGLFLSGAVLVSLIFWRAARRIFAPVERMENVMSAVESGTPAARVGPVPSDDEIGRLARRLDTMLDTLQQQRQELEGFASALDQKVALRTDELHAANLELVETQQQLITSEKLAAVGQLTAGLAHEINNPVAVIQGNLDVLRTVLGEDADPVREEIRLIDAQLERIRQMVANLLQFARPHEYAGYVEDVDVNEVLGASLHLVHHLLPGSGMTIAIDLSATRRVPMNRGELQQVLVNLLTNAIQACGGMGTVRVVSRDWLEDDAETSSKTREPLGVEIAVTDAGPGMDADQLERLFKPFYTTKRQHGTGLGLYISRTLLERYGNRITVESAVGRGSTFHVWLRSGDTDVRAAGAENAR